ALTATWTSVRTLASRHDAHIASTTHATSSIVYSSMPISTRVRSGSECVNGSGSADAGYATRSTASIDARISTNHDNRSRIARSSHRSGGALGQAGPAWIATGTRAYETRAL